MEIEHPGDGTFMILVKDLEMAKQHACWGTYGKSGTEPLTFVLLRDCSTEHLQAILDTQRMLMPDYKVIIKAILKDRGM